MSRGSIVIGRRFIGPPHSANGGYACGRIAAFIDGSAKVTLRRPPPIDTEMRVCGETGGGVTLYNGDTLVASGESVSFVPVPLAAPGFDAAVNAAQRSFDASLHTLPTCFVCGPHREPGDGLRIHVGPIDPHDEHWNGILAAPWIPAENLADDNGIVLAEFVWAALDCPTAYACSSPAGMRHILLGRQAVAISRRPEMAERCVIATQEISHDGRKSCAAATLFGEDGEAIAFCKAIWIEVTPEVHRGAIA